MTPPGLRMAGGLLNASRTVLSTPQPQGPPSITMATEADAEEEDKEEDGAATKAAMEEGSAIRCSSPSIDDEALFARSLITWAAVVGEGRPLELAEGAANGTPAASIRARATAWDGIRTAMVGWPQVTDSAMKELQ